MATPRAIADCTVCRAPRPDFRAFVISATGTQVPVVSLQIVLKILFMTISSPLSAKSLATQKTSY
jgi:CRP-like cAMP-binding protein